MAKSALTQQEIARRFYGTANVYQALSSPAEFGPQHLEQYREMGFLAIENVFSPAEIETARQAMHDLITEGDPSIVTFEPGTDGATLTDGERFKFVRRLFRFCDHEPRLKATMEQPGLLSIVRQLVGEDVRMIQDMALTKQAHVGSEKPWHQDTAYFLMEPLDKIIGTWTALDRATLENGCMHVIPGSHLEGPQPHYHDRDCMLPDDETRAARDMAVPLAPGGVLFFSGLLHHGTPPNNSSDNRWALQFHYAADSCRSIPVEAQAQYFHDAHGPAGCAGWKAAAPRRTMHEVQSN